jgi:uncharacterized protein
MSSERQRSFVTSRYNFHVPVEGGVLLYSARTGAVLRFGGPDGLGLARALSGKCLKVPDGSLPLDIHQQLSAGGFVVPDDHDELSEIRERFHRARIETPLVLTLTTTMDCNLGCYYCYEERAEDHLELKDVASVVALAQERLSRSGKRSLHVDWYGGEPLMNIEFIEAASLALQALCECEQVSYAASIISNGTCWPEDIGSFIGRHYVRQVQISFDGLRDNHNRRRRYRKGYAPPAHDTSSFDLAVGLVDKLLDHTHVDIRINIDRANQGDVIPFIKFARSRGWFNKPFPAVIQPARLSSYSEHSSFMRQSELSSEEYDAVRALVRNEVGIETSVEESETPDGFPYPKTSVCAALANDSVVVGADGRQYRCGLQVAEPSRAVGNIHESPKRQLPVLGSSGDLHHSDKLWWEAFDPTTLPNCSRCSFLPICWGGCPKKHLERDDHAIAEQSRFWRRNLPRLVASGVGAEVSAEFSYDEADQFR